MEAGSGMGTSNLGFCYEQGKGVRRDYLKAMEYYLKAADMGSPEGMFNVGELYERGMGVEKDIAKAAEWYKKASAAGDDDAKFRLTKRKFKDYI